MTTVITFGEPLPISGFGSAETNQQGDKMKKGSVQKIPSGGYAAFDEEGKILCELDEGSLRKVALEMEARDQKSGNLLTERHEAIKKCLGLSDPELIGGVAEVMECTGADLIEGLREFTATPKGAKLWDRHVAAVGASGGHDDD